LPIFPTKPRLALRGEKTYTTPRAPQKYLGPSDARLPGVGNLFTAFDNARLLGVERPSGLVREIPALR
jgi:hypothetical protein